MLPEIEDAAQAIANTPDYATAIAHLENLIKRLKDLSNEFDKSPTNEL